jgi:hypothetical protein
MLRCCGPALPGLDPVPATQATLLIGRLAMAIRICST